MKKLKHINSNNNSNNNNNNNNNNQRGCFAWLKNWDTAPTHTIAGMLELYEQLTPTKVYYARKTQTNRPNDTLCRLCGKTAESIPHVLASCSALAQNKYLARHNAALNVLFWEMLRELQLSDTVPPGILRPSQNPSTSHPRPKHIGIYQSLQ